MPDELSCPLQACPRTIPDILEQDHYRIAMLSGGTCRSRREGGLWGVPGIVHPWEDANIDKRFRLREIIDKPTPSLPHRLCRIRHVISTGHGVQRIGDGVGADRAADQRVWARRAARGRRSAQSCSWQAAHYQMRKCAACHLPYLSSVLSTASMAVTTRSRSACSITSGGSSRKTLGPAGRARTPWSISAAMAG